IGSCFKSIPVSTFTALPALVTLAGDCFHTSARRLGVLGMQLARLTFKSIRARPVVLKLKRPVVARIATIAEWPLILIDLFTEEGVVGRSYLEPYLIKAMRYLIPALHDLASIFKGRRIAPLELYDSARKSLHFV